MSFISSTTKKKCLNALILGSLVFFIAVTSILIYLLVQNGISSVFDAKTITGDVVLSIIILAGWIVFTVIIVTKAITIYPKVIDFRE